MMSILAAGITLGVGAVPTDAPAQAAVVESADESTTAPSRIQIAILLDTSGSMTGLINQARTRIWDVVNELSLARHDDEQPELQIALYRYGAESLPAEQGYLAQLTPLTTDLDLVSEKLFELTTGGSEEYCGWVINSALKQLFWEEQPTGESAPQLRAIIIAGNEPFTQGPVPYQSVIESAKGEGILVNTIHCGSDQDGQGTGWLHAAHVAGGAYHSIDHNQEFVEIQAPQDAEIARLNAELNATYVPFGANGAHYAARQRTQDDYNYRASRRGAANRAAAKASSSYTNAHWDLVDARTKEKIDLTKIPTAHLPLKMQPMTIDERIEYLESMAARRMSIQARIRSLVQEREQFIRSERARRADVQGETLDSAIVRSIREQAVAAGFEFAS